MLRMAVRTTADQARLRPPATLQRRLDSLRNGFHQRLVVLVGTVGQLRAPRGRQHPASEPFAGPLEHGIVFLLRHIESTDLIVEQREEAPAPRLRQRSPPPP